MPHPPALRTRARSPRGGFVVRRSMNDEEFRDLDGVLQTIRLKLMDPRPRFEDSMILSSFQSAKPLGHVGH